MVNEDAKKVWAYIDEHEQEYIDLLKKYCAQPSVSAQNWGMREMAEMIRQTITELGGNGTLIETGGNPFVYGMIDNGAERTLTLYLSIISNRRTGAAKAAPFTEWRKQNGYGSRKNTYQ